jgi:AsmA protein
MNPTKNPTKLGKRRWLKIAGGIVVLILLIMLIAPLFINVDKYRPQIEAAIAERTGRQATLGTIHVRLLPTATAIVDGVQLGNPKGFATGNLLSVDEIKGGLSLGALLHGDIHVTSLTLVHPKLTLEQDENGQVNYSFPSETNAKGAAGGTTSGGSSMFTLEGIDEVTLENLEISLEQIPSRGAKPFVEVAATKVNVTLTNLVLDPNAIHQWGADAKLGGVSVELGALAVPAVFDAGEAKLANGRLEVNFKVHTGNVAVINGSLHMPDVTHAVTQFEISTPELNADKLLAAIRATPATRHSSGSIAQGTSSTPGNELLAQGKISADRVVWAPYSGEKAIAEVRVYGDHMEVTPASMSLYGGTLQLTARTDARQEPETFSANINLKGFDLGKMLAMAPGGMKGKMTGIAELSLQMAGPSGGAWQKTMTGGGNFAIRDGKLPGVNLAGALGLLAKAAGVGDTSFKSIAGDLGISDGRVTTKQTKMDASAGAVELAGGFSILDETMNFEGKATITPTGVGALPTEMISGLLSVATNKTVTSITVPFSLSGTLNDPKFRPGKGLPNFGTSTSKGNTQSNPTNAVKGGLQGLLKKKGQ